jgi:hypothetical protein
VRARVGRLWRRKADRARLDRAQKQKGGWSTRGRRVERRIGGPGGFWRRQGRVADGVGRRSAQRGSAGAGRVRPGWPRLAHCHEPAQAHSAVFI